VEVLEVSCLVSGSRKGSTYFRKTLGTSYNTRPPFLRSSDCNLGVQSKKKKKRTYIHKETCVRISLKYIDNNLKLVTVHASLNRKMASQTVVHTHNVFFFFFWWYWDLNSGLHIARQVLYHFIHITSPIPTMEYYSEMRTDQLSICATEKMIHKIMLSGKNKSFLQKSIHGMIMYLTKF
jgi:hypothetical protein